MREGQTVDGDDAALTLADIRRARGMNKRHHHRTAPRERKDNPNER